MVIPTLGTDHQFNLDYSVAHLSALLDLVSPEAVIIDDYTRWLQNGCLWNLDFPENHVAVAWSGEHAVPILGTLLSPSDSAFPRTQRTLLEFTREYPDIASIREGAQRRLDQTTARIAREYSFAQDPQTLAHLLAVGFQDRASTWTSQQRQSIEQYAARLLDSIQVRLAAHAEVHRWAVMLNWPAALLVAERLDRIGARSLPVQRFLPALDSAVRRRLDLRHLSWILAGQLDEWYGMWAPQAFNGARIAEHLQALRELAPASPAYRFLHARWLMRNRDLPAALSSLESLVVEAGGATFSFPVVGKWLRPPWSSIPTKASLNLGFVYDLAGRRADALKIYQDLLRDSEALNREARASGFTFDDIARVIRSYVEAPYTGQPDEAFRHFPLFAGVPPCAPPGR